MYLPHEKTDWKYDHLIQYSEFENSLSSYRSVIKYLFLKADCAMLEMSWTTAILQLYSQVANLCGNVIVKRINIRLFDLLARFHYILNPPRSTLSKSFEIFIKCHKYLYEIKSSCSSKKYCKK